MRKGIFASMDAVMAIILTMIVISTAFAVLELTEQEDNTLELSRLARDVYEVQYHETTAVLPAWVKTDAECTNANEIATDGAFVYNTGTNSLDEVFTQVCA
jgi:hypothetical protein